jgi:RNA polymerase sigma factor for flagellar operon FliA
VSSNPSGAIQAYQRVADTTRRDELIVSHLPLVKHVVGRLTAELPPGVDVDNLESAGVLGLVEAAGKFDPTRNAQFKTFAYIRIRGAILDELRRNSPLPQHMLERVTLIRKAYRTLPAPVSVDDLAAATGLSADEVADALAAERFNKMVSWEQTAVPNGLSASAAAPPPEAEAERWEAVQQLSDAIEELAPRERMAVTLYYREEMRLKEMSAVMKLSPSRISRILSRAMFELGERLKARGIENGQALSAALSG